MNSNTTPENDPRWEAKCWPCKTQRGDTSVIAKVKSRRVLTENDIPALIREKMEDVRDYLVGELRQGSEIAFGDFFRAYCCRDSKTGKAYASMRSVGKFRACLADVQLRLTYKGKATTAKTVREQAKKISCEADRVKAVPRRTVVCPKCGTEIDLTGFSNV